mgnify:CR=1 FL=1
MGKNTGVFTRIVGMFYHDPDRALDADEILQRFAVAAKESGSGEAVSRSTVDVCPVSYTHLTLPTKRIV